MESHLLQMRGLKPLFKGAFERVFNVASLRGQLFIIFLQEDYRIKIFVC